MSDACVIAIGAVSAFGEGAAAYDAGPVGAPAPSAIKPDTFLAEAGLKRARMARSPAELNVPASADRATDLLGSSLKQVCDQLDALLPQWRARRVGVSIGTSSGGMLTAERFIARRAAGEAVDADLCNAASYFAPFVDALAGQGIFVDGGDGVVPVKRCQVLAACASSTIAIGLGMRWLERGACDVVLAGGYDGISLFVASGFEAIRAVSEGMPQPFRMGRDGMVLGEGAGMVALVRQPDLDELPVRFFVSGFGASADAVHITAPDRNGAGLVRAATAAMADAACENNDIDLVSAHATSTPYNDAAEAKAIHALCPPVLGQPGPLVHPFKAQIGHTLGAAGVLETLAAAHALNTGVAPACYGDAPIDPDAEVPLLERAEARELNKALKLSAAFGGVTASLVVQGEPSQRSARLARPVHVRAHALVSDVDRVALAAATGIARERLARIDDLGQLAIAALASLVEQVGSDAVVGAGVVGGYALATLDTNERFMARMLAKGPRWVDPRLFPATSPNAGAGHCAIAFKLTGPNFAVCSGLGGGLEALLAAAELVACGDAERMVVVAADDAGPAAQAWVAAAAPERSVARGAVAVLLDAEAGSTGAREVALDTVVDHLRGPLGHLGLLAWLTDAK